MTTHVPIQTIWRDEFIATKRAPGEIRQGWSVGFTMDGFGVATPASWGLDDVIWTCGTYGTLERALESPILYVYFATVLRQGVSCGKRLAAK